MTIHGFVAPSRAAQHDQTPAATLVSRGARRASRQPALLAAAVLLALSACSSMPARNAALDQARARLTAAEARPQTVSLAGGELAAARQSVQLGQQALARGDSTAEVDHLAYMAQQQVVIAEDTAASRSDQAVTEGAAAERDRMRLALRTREADRAQLQAAMAQQHSATQSAQLTQSELTNQRQRDRAAQQDFTVDQLQSQLRDLKATQTDRGMVITLGDFLFDSGGAHLRPAAAHGMDDLAGFLRQHPLRQVSIEGYTDSVGTAESNQLLSDRRARAVMTELTRLGVAGTQMRTEAFGEDKPVGDNETAVGRQQNRRVEIVFPGAIGGVGGVVMR